MLGQPDLLNTLREEILAVVSRHIQLDPDKVSVKLDRGKTGAGVYPVVLVSYAIACSTYDDAETAKTVKSYLEYVSSEDGQKVAGEAGAAPMPTSAVDTAKKALENIETA